MIRGRAEAGRRELIDRDLTVREIAAEVDRSYTTVRYWLRRYGLRTTGAARRRQVRYTEGLCRRHGVTRFIATKRGPVCAACAARRVTTWRRRAKRKLVQESGGCCQLCGYSRWVGALQFHHRDPEAKSFGLGTRGLARSSKCCEPRSASASSCEQTGMRRSRVASLLFRPGPARLFIMDAAI
jgi:hypothetical protein